jgi:hypothetical protein
MVCRHVFDSCFHGVVDMLPSDLLAGSNTRRPSRLRRKRDDLGVLQATVQDDAICDPLTSIKGSRRAGIGSLFGSLGRVHTIENSLLPVGTAGFEPATP